MSPASTPSDSLFPSSEAAIFDTSASRCQETTSKAGYGLKILVRDAAGSRRGCQPGMTFFPVRALIFLLVASTTSIIGRAGLAGRVGVICSTTSHRTMSPAISFRSTTPTEMVKCTISALADIENGLSTPPRPCGAMLRGVEISGPSCRCGIGIHGGFGKTSSTIIVTR